MRRRDLLRPTALASAVIAMGWAVTADGADATPPTAPDQLPGAFSGASHEGMGGTLTRDDLAAGFAGTR